MGSKQIVIESGKGAVLRDTDGREYLDANASIWTNLHGHSVGRLNRAISRQLSKVSHSSALGLANIPASHLASRLVEAASRPMRRVGGQPKLKKVFFSDDGSTAMEVAIKLSYEYARRSGMSRRPRFLSLEDAYHGDTVGAVSVGQVPLFHRSFGQLLFKADKVMAPYCYRCPYNKAKPERRSASLSRKCSWECLDLIEKRFSIARKAKRPITGMVTEPIVQGVAGMVVHPEGWLAKTAEIVRGYGAQLIADEVMTGFGRTGGGSLFAAHREKVQPDFLAVAKGLTGGYLPMAATLMTQSVFDSFLGDYDEFKSFFHGHSFTGNQLGAAAALESLDMLESETGINKRDRLENWFKKELESLWAHKWVGDIRHVGLVAGIELVRDWQRRQAFDLKQQVGIRVCREMAERGVLTRPIGNVIVLMPPYCMNRRQVAKMIGALQESVEVVAREEED